MKVRINLARCEKKLFIGFISLFFLILAANALAATYYVAPNGSDSNPGTSSRPWENPQMCADEMVGGDTCIVRNGVYDDHDKDNRIVSIYGDFSGASASKMVTFQAENAGGAVLDGASTGQGGFGFLLNKTSYVKIAGFEIMRVYSALKIQQSNDIYIDNCEIHNIGRNWVQPLPCDSSASKSYTGISSSDDSYDITVTNCDLYDIGRKHVQPEGTCWRDFLWDHAIYATGKGWLIQNSKFWDIHSGWHIKVDGFDGATSQSTHIIRNNDFYDGHGGSAFKREVYWGQILITMAHGTYCPNDVIIENNTFSDPEQDIAIQADDYINLKGSVFRNNVTNASTLYEGGYGQPTLSGNKTNSSSSASAPDPASDPDPVPVWSSPDPAPDTSSPDNSGSSSGCNLSSKFEQSTIRTGVAYYTDRSYIIKGGLPNWMVGRNLIETPNDDRLNNSASGYLRFSNPIDWYVYVLFDSRAANLPDWLDRDGWTEKSSYKITTSLNSQAYLQAWSKRFPAGACVDLGGNYGPGSSTENRSNFIVVYGK